MRVLSNGEVTICCPDYDGHTSLGNLHISSLGDLLRPPRAEAIREGFQRMRVPNPYCQRCQGSTNPGMGLNPSLWLCPYCGMMVCESDRAVICAIRDVIQKTWEMRIARAGAGSKGDHEDAC